MDIEETPVHLPSAPAVQIAQNITLQPPLTRRGHGPGLIIVLPDNFKLVDGPSPLDPQPMQKWAEEGYSVLQIRVPNDPPSWNFTSDLERGVTALEQLPSCDDKGSYGCIGGLLHRSYFTVTDFHGIAKDLEMHPNIITIIRYRSSPAFSTKPVLFHDICKGTLETRDGSTKYIYPEAASEYFVIPGHKDFHPSSAALAHTRSLTFLKKIMGGPIFDLEAIWDEHCAFEFGNRSVANTMGTMVQEPYVNHIPTMTGGIGRERLTNFYRYHFIWNNPEDTALELVSRTVGIDRVIDEFIFSLTHNKVVDWLIPGVPPTGKKLRIPMTSVVNVRGDRLYHEHIAWDQATVLVQLGLLPQYLPFPYPLPDGRTPAPGKRFEYRVPAAGVETAIKLLDETAVPSNGMFEFAVREVDDVL
ncbi:dienelactone hydrolase [Bisporella sp. PMI_857]|nr:dienelactone hydrolase [Bisporella sp. PMI_857]